MSKKNSKRVTFMIYNIISRRCLLDECEVCLCVTIPCCQVLNMDWIIWENIDSTIIP
jgi:hypothetical protein